MRRLLCWVGHHQWADPDDRAGGRVVCRYCPAWDLRIRHWL